MSSPSELLDKLGEVFVVEEKPNYLKNDADYVEQYELFRTKVSEPQNFSNRTHSSFYAD